MTGASAQIAACFQHRETKWRAVSKNAIGENSRESLQGAERDPKGLSSCQTPKRFMFSAVAKAWIGF